MAAVHLGIFYFLSPYPMCCCNSHPATISSSVTTPSFACCSLSYFHSCLSPCSHHFLKTSLDAVVSPHHPPPFLSHVLMLGRTSRCINPNYSAWHLQRAEPRRFCWTSGSLGLSEDKTDPGSLIHQTTSLSNKQTNKTSLERYMTYCYFINNVAYNCFK